MVCSAVDIIKALARVSTTEAAAFVRRIIRVCGTTRRKIRDAIRALVAATQSTTTQTSRTTTRVYTTRYAASKRDKRSGPASEKTIVDWETEIIDVGDGCVECIAKPVYGKPVAPTHAETLHQAHEMIETTEALDMAALLAREGVISVTCEEINTTLTTMSLAMATTTASQDSMSQSNGAADPQQAGMKYARLLPENEDVLDQVKDVVVDEDTASELEQEGRIPGEFDGATMMPALPIGWATIALGKLNADTSVDWTAKIRQSPLSYQPVFGTVLRQRR